MRVTYDPKFDVAYIYLVEPVAGGAARTVADLANDLVLDFDAEGRLLGIEFLSARKRLPAAVLESAETPESLPEP